MDTKIEQSDDIIKNDYPLFICHLICHFMIKEDHLPCIQIKGTGRFTETEYLKGSQGQDVELYLTANDLLDKVEIFDSDNDKFNEVFTSCYYEYGLVNPLLKPFNNISVCTSLELNIFNRSRMEFNSKVRTTVNNLKSLEWTEKEKNILFKATKLLYDEGCKSYKIRDECIDNKSLRIMAELELKLTGSEEVNFEDVYGYYMVIV